MSQTEAFELIHDIIIDAYFITDREGKIIKYNRLFYSLFPRKIARSLKGQKITDVMDISVDIVSKVFEEKAKIRLDEITGKVEDMEPYSFILSAIPVEAEGEDSQLEGCIVVMRNVTDEAMVQVKYQQMLESEAEQRERLKEELSIRTNSLVEISQKYYELKAKNRQKAKNRLSPFLASL
ncbi:MAG: PAS domain-containing protein, partial [Deltaproteobacteria bacterium]|nr:PAS domain-containing protein [Deltaproteobacteria bacterium]